jgi:hypothetical protein
MARWKGHHGIPSLAEVIPVDVSAGCKVTLNDPGPIEPVASTIAVLLLKGDPLVRWSSLYQRWCLTNPFVLRVRAVPPLLQVLFQVNHIARHESNIFEHSIINKVKDIDQIPAFEGFLHVNVHSRY